MLGWSYICDLKRQQISLGTHHRNSRRTWIANLLYRFTGGRLILEGWHRASDISSSAEGLNKKDLFLRRLPVFEQRLRFSSFTVTWARAKYQILFFLHILLFHELPFCIYFFSASSVARECAVSFRNKSDQFGHNRSAFEERTRYRISYYSTGIFLLFIFPPIVAYIHWYTLHVHVLVKLV